VIENFHSENPRVNQVCSSLEDAWRQSRLSGEILTGKPNWHIGIRRFVNLEDKETGAFEITNRKIARSSEDHPSVRTRGRDQSLREIPRMEKSIVGESSVGKLGIPWTRGPIHIDTRNLESR
jgi:hypothetical protein